MITKLTNKNISKRKGEVTTTNDRNVSRNKKL